MPFEKPVALKLARHAEDAYLSDEELDNIYGDRLESTFNVRIDDSDILKVFPYVRGFILKELDKNTIAFKGTDDPTDWILNIQFTKTSISWLNKYHPIPKGHKGFTNAYKAIRNHILSSDRNYKNTIYVTGHSLGAAIATLAALDLKNFFPEKTVIVYTFASPRMGDRKFAEIFNSEINNKTQRVYIKGDLVPETPFTTNGPDSYKHVDKKVQLQNDDLNVLAKHRIRNIINTIYEYNK